YSRLDSVTPFPPLIPSCFQFTYSSPSHSIFTIMPQSDEDNCHFEVKTILAERLKKGKKEFLVKWKDGNGAEWSKDTYEEWIPEDSLCCPDLINEFRTRAN
ncbi:hypothetical protein PENTCL1PPCAC_17457, partial [Pristionchus entomophagus]